MNKGLLMDNIPIPFCSDKIDIRKNVQIKKGTVIGGEGFWWRNEKDGMYTKEHLFGVKIHENVNIGSNCTIDRGRWRDTVIGENSKLDNLCHIAHNVHIGPNNIITAGCIFGGSVTTGRNCYFGLNSTIRNGINIGNNVTVGMGAVVVKDVPDNYIVYGNPAEYRGENDD